MPVGGQKQCRFMIYQGESLDPEGKSFLDEFIIDVPGTATKTEFLRTTFTYDINSMLYIEKLNWGQQARTKPIVSVVKVKSKRSTRVSIWRILNLSLINCPLRPTLNAV